MKKTISKVIVRDKDIIKHLLIEGGEEVGHVVPVSSLRYRLFKIGRCKRYRVTYSIDKNGPLKVIEGPNGCARWHRVVRVHSGIVDPRDNESERFVCFLPDNWLGKRVRRTMKTLKGE